jgi:hypothetical protein
MKPAAISTLFGTLILCTPYQAQAHGKLNADELEELFSNTTQLCRKEKDQSTCSTYFSEDGVIKRRLHTGDVRREGEWETDLEHDQLCITWKGKKKPLCMDVYQNKDGTLDMYKGSKHLSTVLSFTPGNAENL